jgi:regulator of sigma E protease
MNGVEGGVVVLQVAQNSPAAEAGIIAGDELVEFETVDDFIAEAKQRAETQMEIVINREGEQKTIYAIPRSNPPVGEGALGIALGESGIAQVSFWQALGEAALVAWGMFKGIFVLLLTLIGSLFGLASGEAAQYITGPIGVFQATAQAAATGWVNVLYLAAIISLNLAAINIFPFPALDGGRVLMVLIEKIKRSPVRANTQALINGVGFFILMALLLWVSVRDVIRIW